MKHPTTQVTRSELRDLHRRLSKLFPDNGWRVSGIRVGKGKRSKVKQAPREQSEGSQ